MSTFNFHNVIKKFFITLLLISLMSCQVGNTLSTNSNNLIFVHEKHGYSLSYPQNWDAHTFVDGNHGDEEVSAIFNRHLQIVPAVTVAVREQELSTLENAIEWGEFRLIERYQGIVEGYKLSEIQIIERNNKGMAERDYTVFNNGRIAKKKDIYFVADGKMFIFTYAAESDDFDEDISVLYEIVDSFTISNNN